VNTMKTMKDEPKSTGLEVPVIDSQRLKAQALEHYEAFNIHRYSDHPEVKGVAEHIYEELNALCDSKHNKRIWVKHLVVIVLDLFMKWSKDPSLFTSFSRGEGAYKPKSRYNETKVSKLIPKIIDSLVIAGYVIQHTGYIDRIKGKSRLSRMIATPKLINLLTIRFQVTEDMAELSPQTECIILRDIDERSIRIDVEYEDSSDVRIDTWRHDLCAYNNLLRSTRIEVPSYPKDGIPSRDSEKPIKISLHDKFVRRIFNNASWQDGGRFYGGWWQNIPKKWREKITIFSHPVTEIDYSGLHINLLYALKGISYTHDPYQLEGLEQTERMRSFLKKILLSAINAENETKATMSVQKAINFNPEELGWVNGFELNTTEIINRFAEQHKPIREYFFSGFGVKLQNMDSLIAEKIVNHFTRRQIPVLCVHDSFLIRADKAVELNEVMDSSFVETLLELQIDTQHIPKTKVEGVGLRQPYIVTTDLLRSRDIVEIIENPYERPSWWGQVEQNDNWEVKEYYR